MVQETFQGSQSYLNNWEQDYKYNMNQYSLQKMFKISFLIFILEKMSQCSKVYFSVLDTSGNFIHTLKSSQFTNPQMVNQLSYSIELKKCTYII